MDKRKKQHFDEKRKKMSHYKTHHQEIEFIWRKKETDDVERKTYAFILSIEVDPFQLFLLLSLSHLSFIIGRFLFSISFKKQKYQQKLRLIRSMIKNIKEVI